MVVCTIDASWQNRCSMHKIQVIQGPVSNQLEISDFNSNPNKNLFELTEGMCAHHMSISTQYIALSCSKVFPDGSIRKVRVYTNPSIGDRAIQIIE